MLLRNLRLGSILRWTRVAKQVQVVSRFAAPGVP